MSLTCVVGLLAEFRRTVSRRSRRNARSQEILLRRRILCYLCGWASSLSLTAVRWFASYSVQRVFGATVEFGGDGVGLRPDDGG